MKYRIINPIVPTSKVNPAGTTTLVVSADGVITAKYKRINEQCIAVFDRIPVYVLNADDDQYRVAYSSTPEQMAAINTELGYIITAELANGGANIYWYGEYVRNAMRAGTAQSSANLSKLSEAYKSSRPLSSVLNSAAYQNRIGFALQKSYAHWTGLSDALKSELSQIIAEAVLSGRNPKAVRSLIADRIDVSRSKASQYAQTDITDSLRQARWYESEQAQSELGLDIRLLWTSSLKATTRPWHASRHGRVYTVDEVKAFYGRDGNRYNCYCAQTEVLMQDGKPVLTQSLKDKMATERSDWE